MSNTKGIVYLIGAGPGDPGLFTLKGASLLAKADVVLYDRLVSEEILQHAPPNAELILIGKQGNGVSTPQAHINQLLIQYANEGKVVARLKGGDVSFFSNIFDELETLTANHIPYQIVPGVTAASGCAAYAGIPLTARGFSDEVHVLALHNLEKIDSNEWSRIADLKGTIVLYMSSSNLIQITQQLKQNGIEERKLVIIEQGTTSFQQQYFSTVYKAVIDFAEIKITSPALVIIGEVVSLSEKFNWHQSSEKGLFFKELSQV
jgi:uroporphyrin-III C-methyltransferase/precorrin-2 dehydrogenase/sirohydrochlorin ferrochelatase